LNGLIRSAARAGLRAYSVGFNRRVRARFLVREITAYPLAFTPPRLSDPQVESALSTYAGHQYREWIYDLREPCYVEPSGGFVFGSRGEWLRDPFLYHQLVRHPPYRNILALMRRRGGIQTFERALSLRCSTEQNYWHFYDDVLSKLRLADEVKVPEDVPILVGDGLWRQAFFQDAIRRGALRRRNWVLQDAFVRVHRLILTVPMSFQRANLEYALRALETPGPVRSERRLFLRRGQRRSRSLVNIDDLLPWLIERGFEVVDTDGLSLAAQMELFGAARLVVGNHGAGLANLVYRVGQPLDLVEVFSPGFIRPHFVCMAQMFGFGYDAVVGTAAGDEGDFRLDPDRFKDVVSRAMGRIRSSSG